MVKSAAKRTFDGQLELGRQLAEAEFMRQVAEQKVRGERMFQEEVEKGRKEADMELRRRVRSVQNSKLFKYLSASQSQPSRSESTIDN